MASPSAEGEPWAWECFASAPPQEAAECDWRRYVALVQSWVPGITEETIRNILAELPDDPPTGCGD